MQKRLKRFWWLLLLLLACGAFLVPVLPASQPPPTLSSPLPAPVSQPLRYETRSLPGSVVHILIIPAGGQYRVVPAVSETVATVEQFAQASGAIAALNAGFFDPTNQQSTSFVTQAGVLVADPRQNQRLINNPQLTPYLDKILNRTEFRRYQCEGGDRYDITLHQAAAPAGCRLLDALSGGPRLLPRLTAEAEGFWAVANGAVVRDPIGISQKNARSAVGLTAEGAIVWVMVAQTAAANAGLSLPELAELLRSYSVVQAVNLDGGSSSSLYYQGRAIYGKRLASGEVVQRPVKSVLLLQKM